METEICDFLVFTDEAGEGGDSAVFSSILLGWGRDWDWGWGWGWGGGGLGLDSFLLV